MCHVGRTLRTGASGRFMTFLCLGPKSSTTRWRVDGSQRAALGSQEKHEKMVGKSTKIGIVDWIYDGFMYI